MIMTVAPRFAPVIAVHPGWSRKIISYSLFAHQLSWNLQQLILPLTILLFL
jgi:hypothetical protein